jgi:hypothetical protein
MGARRSHDGRRAASTAERSLVISLALADLAWLVFLLLARGTAQVVAIVGMVVLAVLSLGIGASVRWRRRLPG